MDKVEFAVWADVILFALRAIDQTRMVNTRTAVGTFQLGDFLLDRERLERVRSGHSGRF